MHIIVMDRRMIETDWYLENNLPAVPRVCISIYSSPVMYKYGAPKIPIGYFDEILSLQFDDIDDKIFEKYKDHVRMHGMVLFSVQQAKEIILFAREHRDKCVVVHCDAGVSRSPAVAAALDKIFNGCNGQWFTEYVPNEFVYHTILETYDE